MCVSFSGCPYQFIHILNSPSKRVFFPVPCLLTYFNINWVHKYSKIQFHVEKLKLVLEDFYPIQEAVASTRLILHLPELQEFRSAKLCCWDFVCKDQVIVHDPKENSLKNRPCHSDFSYSIQRNWGWNRWSEWSLGWCREVKVHLMRQYSVQ